MVPPSSVFPRNLQANVRSLHINYRRISKIHICGKRTSRDSRSDNREDPPSLSDTHQMQTPAQRKKKPQNTHPGQNSEDGLWLLDKGDGVHGGPGSASSERSHSVHFGLGVRSTLPAPRLYGRAAALRCRDGSLRAPAATARVRGGRAPTHMSAQQPVEKLLFAGQHHRQQFFLSQLTFIF